MRNVRKKSRKRGFTIVELVIVIIIISVLATIGFAVGGKQISRSKMDATSNTMKIFGSEAENAIIDLGFLTTTEYPDDAYVQNYFKLWNQKYLTNEIDYQNFERVDANYKNKNDGSTIHFCGVVMNSAGNSKDPWGENYKLFYMIPDSGENYRIMFVSGGPNGYFSDDCATAYENENWEDDVVLIMQPRS